MTVSNTESSITYQGNGVTTVFPYTFRMDTAGDVVVLVYDSLTFTEVELDVADYIITGLGTDVGGDVTYNPLGVPIPATSWLTVKRVISYTQELNLTNQSAYIPTALESQLDRLVFMIQQLDAEVALTLQLPAGSAISAADMIAAATITSANVAAAEAAETAAAASAAAAAASAGSLTSMSVAELWAGVNTAKFASAATLKSLWGRGTDVAAGATVTIPDDGNYFHLTGVGGPITDFDFNTAGNGRDAWLYVESTPTINNGANLVIIGAANYVCRAGDILHVSQDNGDAVKVQVFRVDGTVMPAGIASTTDVLTGTNTLKVASPDAIAALWELGTPVASAATVTLGEGRTFHITGSTGPITDIDFATAKDGREAVIVFDATPTLTHSATLQLPGAANITAAVGDRMGLHQDNGDTIIVDWYQKADGTPVISSGGGSSCRTTGTTSRTSSTLSDVANGALAVAANHTYSFTFSGKVTTSNTASRGFQFAVTVPSGSTLSVTGNAVQDAATTTYGGFTTTSGAVLLTEATDAGSVVFYVTITGTVTTSVTSGNIQLQFAQASPNASASTLTTGFAGSAVLLA